MPPSPFARDTFDVIYAYFGFLPPLGAGASPVDRGVHPPSEAGRRPASDDPRSRLHCDLSLLAWQVRGDPYQELLANAFPDPGAANGAYDAGSFVYVAYP
jgi:hypothetical protein